MGSTTVSTTDNSTDSSSTTYYNTSTHETKTLEEMVAAGWVELSEADYGDTYQYPALYNTTTHDVLDMTEGDKSGDWMVVSSSSDSSSSSETSTSEDSSDSSSVTYYNTSTHETKTLEEMVAAGWVELSEADYGDTYQYPALYNTTTHDVLDMTEGDKSGDWMVVSSSSDSSSSSETSTSEDSSDSSSVTYYNTSTHETRTLAEMIAAGWMELSEADYGDTYQYPAIYSAGVISDENGPIRQALDMSEGDKVGDWIVISSDSGDDDMSENTQMVGTTNNDYTADSRGFASIAAAAPVEVTAYEVGEKCTLDKIKDYDGNLHGGDTSEEASSSYEYHGMLDVNGDGTFEAIFTNSVTKRWVTAEVHSTYGAIDFDRNGSGGGTRVVGIYEDPLISEGKENGGFLSDGVTPAPADFGVSEEERYVEVNGETIDRLALNSQVRFQNDLDIDNLSAKHSGDYDSDGVSEVYWKTNDGTAYLRAIMHDDGNIRYANYQSATQMNDYLTTQGHESVITEII